MKVLWMKCPRAPIRCGLILARNRWLLAAFWKRLRRKRKKMRLTCHLRIRNWRWSGIGGIRIWLRQTKNRKKRNPQGHGATMRQKAMLGPEAGPRIGAQAASSRFKREKRGLRTGNRLKKKLCPSTQRP